jgi:hypothetical protein
MTASCDADYAVPPGKYRRKIVEHMRRITATGQQEQGRTGTAPIEHFQPHAGVNLHKLHCMRRRILPLPLLWCGGNCDSEEAAQDVQETMSHRCCS